MVYKLFDKKYSGGVATLSNKPTIKNENISNKELEKEFHKTITFTVYRYYLVCRSRRYAINKQI